MAETAENRNKHSRAWPAESEIEAYRRDLEASFLLEESALEARRNEVVERLDQMEENTLSQAHAERANMKNRREQIIASLQEILDQRYQNFLSGFDREKLLEELARESMSLLCSTCGEAKGVSH